MTTLAAAYTAARDVLFNAKDSKGNWIFALCEASAEQEWESLTNAIKEHKIRNPDHFADTIVSFLKRMHIELYKLEWDLIEKLVKRSLGCFLARPTLESASTVASSVDISRMIKMAECAAVDLDTPLCFKAIFQAGVKLGKLQKPRPPSKKRSASGGKNIPAATEVASLVPCSTAADAPVGNGGVTPPTAALQHGDRSQDPVNGPQPALTSDILESISTAPSIESFEGFSEDPPESPPELIQLPATIRSGSGSTSSVTIAATKRKLSVGEKVLIVDTAWARDCVRDYIGQVGTVVGIPGSGWYDVEFRDKQVKKVRGGSMAGETVCRPENMKYKSATPTTGAIDSGDWTPGSNVVIVSGPMYGKEGVVVSTGNGWVKIDTPNFGRVAVRASELRHTGYNGLGLMKDPQGRDLNLLCKSHLTGRKAQLHLHGRRISLGEFSSDLGASRAHDIAYIRITGPRDVRPRDLCNPLVDYAMLPESEFCVFDDIIRSQLTGTPWRGLKSCSREHFLANKSISDAREDSTIIGSEDRSKKGMKTVTKVVVCRRNSRALEAARALEVKLQCEKSGIGRSNDLAGGVSVSITNSSPKSDRSRKSPRLRDADDMLRPPKRHCVSFPGSESLASAVSTDSANPVSSGARIPREILRLGVDSSAVNSKNRSNQLLSSEGRVTRQHVSSTVQAVSRRGGGVSSRR